MAVVGLALLTLLAGPPPPPSNTYVFQMETECAPNRTTVHGLWPEWAQWCDGPPFNATALAPIAARMQQDWPSCEPAHNSTAFHAHEWAKHGTCTGLAQLDYFGAGLDLFDVYRDSGALRICLDRRFGRVPCAP